MQSHPSGWLLSGPLHWPARNQRELHAFTICTRWLKENEIIWRAQIIDSISWGIWATQTLCIPFLILWSSPEDRWADSHAIKDTGGPWKPGDLPKTMELASVRAGILIQALD